MAYKKWHFDQDKDEFHSTGGTKRLVSGLLEKKRQSHTFPPLGQELLPAAPYQAHYYNHSYEGYGENRALRRRSGALRKNTGGAGMERGRGGRGGERKKRKKMPDTQNKVMITHGRFVHM